MAVSIISTFREKPKTKTGQWAMGLGLSTLLIGPTLGTFAAAIRPIIDKIIGESIGIPMGFALGVSAFILSIVALVVGIKALKIGERSWMVFLGFIPAVLASMFWIFMITGEFLFPH